MMEYLDFSAIQADVGRGLIITGARDHAA